MTFNSQSIIRLDWDNITWSDCRDRIEQIKQAQLVKQIELRFSPKSGFHILVSSYFYLPVTRIWYLRRLWGDDGNKLVLDILYYPAHYRDVLFQRKGDWYEQPLTTYTRLHYNSNIWKQEDVQSESTALIQNHSKKKTTNFPSPTPRKRTKMRGEGNERSR